MSSRNNSLELALKSDLCSGCGLCEGLLGPERVKMSIDSSGYLRPVIASNICQAESKLFEEVCPGLNVSHSNGTNGHDPIWGPILDVKIAAATDSIIRHLGSSGGLLSALQIDLLETKAVDFVVNVAVSRDNPFENEVAICRTREDIINSAGSRYAPSAPLSRIKELLSGEGIFAFVGKPCDVAALRKLAKYDPRVNQKVPVMLSFMCAGVPSIKGTHRIIEKLGSSIEDVAAFRYRGDGWPGYAKAILKDGSTRAMTYEDSWKNILSPYVQWRCKLCPDGTGEFADITGADAWYANEDGTPNFSEHEGRSFALVRTKAGKDLLDAAIIRKSVTHLGDATVADIETVQFHQAYRRKSILARYFAMRILLKRYPEFDYLVLFKAGKKNSLFALFRTFLGSIKRAIIKGR